ncbi:MAG: Sua5/YciO/YrdC/YwlC family protein [Planctomycetota bacterium]
MPVVINLRQADDPRDLVHRAVQALAEGKLVVFPTETVYIAAASALHAAGVEQLWALRRPETGRGLSLAVKSADAAWDYAPGLSPLAQRLARRGWPGPLGLVLPNDHPDSLVRRLPEMVQQAIAPYGRLNLRVPAHPVVEAVLGLSVGPLVVSSIPTTQETGAVTAEEVLARVGDRVALVLDDGRTRYAQPATAIEVDGHRYRIVRNGVLNESTVKRLASFILLFVCTGNTCRSPMAESLMRRRVADKLGCTPDTIDEHGVLVMSAGVAASAGSQASLEAQEVVSGYGVELQHHESQPVTDRLVRFADLILTMTRGHRQVLLGQWPEVASRVRLLHRGNGDVSDPIGGSVEVYRRCAEQIDAQLENWMREIDWSSLPSQTGDSAGE